VGQTELGWDGAWVGQSLGGTELGWDRAWVGQSLGGTELGWDKSLGGTDGTYPFTVGRLK
jgi:hypothetical protein